MGPEIHYDVAHQIDRRRKRNGSVRLLPGTPLPMTPLARLLVLTVLVAACHPASPKPPLADPAAEAPAHLRLRAELLQSEGLGFRFRVQGLPSGHGYQTGRLLALYGAVPGLDELQPVGAAEVIEALDHTLELVALWLDPAHQAAPHLEVREMPQGHHFGSRLGQVLPDDSDPRRARLNMGEAHGVEVIDTGA